MENQKVVIVPKVLAEALIEYLVKKPFEESADFIGALKGGIETELDKVKHLLPNQGGGAEPVPELKSNRKK